MTSGNLPHSVLVISGNLPHSVLITECDCRERQFGDVVLGHIDVGLELYILVHAVVDVVKEDADSRTDQKEPDYPATSKGKEGRLCEPKTGIVILEYFLEKSLQKEYLGTG